jgi:hypothetical protein
LFASSGTYCAQGSSKLFHGPRCELCGFLRHDDGIGKEGPLKSRSGVVPFQQDDRLVLEQALLRHAIPEEGYVTDLVRHVGVLQQGQDELGVDKDCCFGLLLLLCVFLGIVQAIDVIYHAATVEFQALFARVGIGQGGRVTVARAERVATVDPSAKNGYVFRLGSRYVLGWDATHHYVVAIGLEFENDCAQEMTTHNKKSQQ